MNEIFDKMILRIVFTIFICLTLVLYKFAHIFLYPSSKQQLLKKFYPSKNSPDTIHLFGRILGLGIVYSNFYFYLSNGIMLALTTFFIQATLIFLIYLLSIYIIESIVFYNFEYIDEIIKRKNYAYAIISFTNTLSISLILSTVIRASENNFILFLLMWLLSMVILGFSVRSFPIVSKLSLNKLIVQKNISVAFSYSGFILGWTLIISSSLENNMRDYVWYNIQVVLKILLSIIVFPLFRWGLIKIFKIENDFRTDVLSEDGKELLGPEIGFGLYEGAIFLVSCLLTSVITGNIFFGSFYPSY